jgi:hypothetical protein
MLIKQALILCKVLKIDDDKAIIYDATEHEFDPAEEAWCEHLLDLYWDYFYYAPREAAALDELDEDEMAPLN